MVGLTLLFGASLGFAPAFGGPGYEVALAGGLFLPSVVAVASAAEADRYGLEPFDAFCRGFANGVLVFVAFLVTVLLHGLRVGFCDSFGGLEFVALGPGVGCLLAGVWGAASAEVARRVRRRFVHGALRTFLALLGPLLCIGVGVWRFYSSPMIFGFDPFVGYFSGALYDTVVDAEGLRTYRVGSAATLFAAFVLALHLAHDERGRLVYQSIRRPGLVGLGLVAGITSIIHSLAGSELGHWHTKSSISDRLGAVIEGQRCLLVYPRSVRAEDAQRLARECEGHVAANEAYLGVRGPDRITVFLFTSAAQKQELMGAGGTNIAKPWRAEIYIQESDYPHRVLGHELAHVVAGSMGQGPFKVAGTVGGLLPNPGLIEGVATAASPKEDELSPMEWAKAMKDLGILPRLSRLFALGFFGENSQTAYTVSAAFVGWVHDRFGKEAVRDWYGGKPLPEVVGKDWDELESAWHAELDVIALDASAKELARAKFDRPGFFSRKCPRLVDGCRVRADDLASSGDHAGAIAELERARAFEPGNPSLRLDMAEAQVDAGDLEAGKAALQEIIDDGALPANVRDKATERRADLALSEGDDRGAESRYREVLGRTFDESRARTLEVKIAAAKDVALRPAVLAMLIGYRGRKPDRTVAAELLGGLERERPTDGLTPYLLGRYYAEKEDFSGAAEHFGKALTRRISVPRVRSEALRLAITSACALGNGADATRLLGEYAREPGVRAARFDAARRLVARTLGTSGQELPRLSSAGGAEPPGKPE